MPARMLGGVMLSSPGFVRTSPHRAGSGGDRRLDSALAAGWLLDINYDDTKHTFRLTTPDDMRIWQ